MVSIFLYATQGQEEDDRERFFEDDNFTFPPEGFNLDFQSDRFEIRKVSYTDKKRIWNFLIYKEIQMGAVAKSHMRKGFLLM